MSDKEWLESLKDGDEVYVSGNYGAVGTIEKVSKTTATQIVVEQESGHGKFESRFRRKDGFLVGADRWARGHIEPVTDERRSQIARMELRTFIHQIQWKNVPTVKLKRIVAILREGEK